MKFQTPYQSKVIGSAAALALLLAMGTANAGKPDGSAPNNKGGASIGVSNTCVLVEDHPDTGTAALRVTTTIINKSSDVVDEDVDFTVDGTTVRAKEKGSGKGEKYQQVGDLDRFTAELGINTTDIQLCKDGSYLGPDNTVSLNASISINVDNDNKGEYASRCSDDPATDGVDEGKVVISAAELDLLCVQ